MGIKKTLSSIVLAGALAFGNVGCDNKKTETLVKVDITGEVLNENYREGFSSFSEATMSKYSFTLETEYGRKTIEIVDGDGRRKESVDSFINIGDRLKISVPENEVASNSWRYTSGNFFRYFKILEKE